MQNQDTTKRSYTVTATAKPEAFENRKQFLSWSLALRHLNKHIKDQAMSILLITDTEVVKAYHFKQRVSF